jgi:tetratricopeptide (TPR) repeat protein
VAGDTSPEPDPTGPARAYFEEGRRQETAGMLVEATRMYQLALTLTPQAADIAAALERVQAERRRLAEDHFQRGQAAYAKGAYREGREAVLTALRLWPDHAGALAELREREKITAPRQIRHIVRKGETLTTIALNFYGDAQKYTLLARHNRIEDPRRIRAGQVIVVPVDGMGPMSPGTSEETISRTAARQAAHYREAGREMLQAGDYPAAMVEFRKVLNATPDAANVQADLARAYDAYGRELWDRQDIDPAREQFEACLTLRESCPACRDQVQACEESYKERLYSRAMTLLGNNHAEAALFDLRIVARLDPAYRDVAQKIRAAERASD